jgi:hypothetical protein
MNLNYGRYLLGDIFHRSDWQSFPPGINSRKRHA